MTPPRLFVKAPPFPNVSAGSSPDGRVTSVPLISELFRQAGYTVLCLLIYQNRKLNPSVEEVPVEGVFDGRSVSSSLPHNRTKGKS